MIVAMQDRGYRRADPTRHRADGRARLQRTPHHRRNADHPRRRRHTRALRGHRVSRCSPACTQAYRISSPYKLAGRGFRPEGTTRHASPTASSSAAKQVVIMAGPCSVESREQILAQRQAGRRRRRAVPSRRRIQAAQLALQLPGHGRRRPRSSCAKSPTRHGLLVITEVMEISQIEVMLPYIDCFQVGARNMQNFNLLRELGHVRKPVL